MVSCALRHVILVCSATQRIHLKQCSKQQLHQLTIGSAIHPSSTLVNYKTNVYQSNMAEIKLILDILSCCIMYWKPMVDESFLEVEGLHDFTAQNTQCDH